jgi:hypothetical protein
MKKYIIIISLIVTSSSALGKLLFNEMLPQWANIVLLLLIFGLSLLVLILQNPVQKLLELVNITNNIPKNEAMITTVSDFLDLSKEEALIKGDVVKILTNNLSNYDLLDKTIDIMADNLAEGVCYEYYLPLENDYQLEEDLKKLIKKIAEKTSINSFLNFKIFKTKQPLLFSYAVVKNNRDLNGYWYIATSNTKKNLTIVPILGESKSQLVNIFNKINIQEISAIDITKGLT